MVEIVVPVKGKVKIRLPYAADSWNKTWLKGMSRSVKYLESGIWVIDRRSWVLVKDACVARFDRVDLWRHFRVSGSLCTVACQMARPESLDDCVCICGGEYHGRADYYKEIEKAGDLVLATPGSNICRYQRFENGQSVSVTTWEVGG